MRRVVLLTTLFCLSNIFGEVYAANVLTPNTTTLSDLGVSVPKNYPLAVIPAAQVGLALAPVTPVTQVLGLALTAANIAYSAYYAQQPKNPVYAEIGETGNPDDTVFCPAFNAIKANFVSPESYPNSQEQYIGKEGALGARVQALADFVQSHPEAYPELAALLQTYQSAADLGLGAGSVGNIFTAIDGHNYIIIGSWDGPFKNGDPAYDEYLGQSGGYFYYKRGGTLKRANCQYSGCTVYMANFAETSEPPNVIPQPGSINFQTLKPALKSALDTATIVNEVRNIIRDLPENQKVATDNPAPTQVPAQQATPITNQDLQNFYTANTTNIYNKYQDTVTNNTTVQGDITNEQAKAAAELAEKQAQEVDKETEPSINVPSSFYTPTCDLSQKSLSDCLNYQQVLDASSAFQETALYQLPNLLLNCLGYVEGSGCEYPPKITVDLSSRFITDPMVLDMAPFDSVVQVMKFFFAILCIIGTGKAVMVLFGGGV